MKKTPTILEAMEDPDLFGRWFKPKRKLFGMAVDSWAAWKSFLRNLFALPLEPGDLDTYTKHTARTDISTTAYREALAIVGRRGGKSLIAALISCYLAVFIDYTDVLQPGETGIVMLLASDRRQAQVLLGYIFGFFDKVPMLRRMVVSKLKESIVLSNGITIEVHTSSYRAVRGFTVVAAICDEICFWASSVDSASPDTEVLNALRPAMLSVPTALLLSISSPYAKRGAAWELYRENFGTESAPVLVWQSDTKSMNENVPSAFIKLAYFRNSAAAKSEYGGLWRDDISGFLSLENLDAVTKRGRISLPRLSNTTYKSFVDMSGGKSDSACLAIAHLDGEKAVLDLVVERPAPHSPEAVTKEFCSILKSYGIHEVVGDKYAASWVSDAFAKGGILYSASEKDRSKIYRDFLPMVLSQQVELLDNPKMISQFLGLERKIGRNEDQIDHGPGGHDDCCNAAAGALVLAGGRGADWVVDMAHDASSARKNLRPLPSIEEEKAAIVAGGAGVRREPAKHDRRFGAPRINNVGTSAVIEKPVLAHCCPRCGNVGLAQASAQGISGEIRESCPCGWTQVTPGRTGLRFH